jgi:hypothetical protein
MATLQYLLITMKPASRVEGFVCGTGPGKSPTFAESAKMGHPRSASLKKRRVRRPLLLLAAVVNE